MKIFCIQCGKELETEYQGSVGDPELHWIVGKCQFCSLKIWARFYYDELVGYEIYTIRDEDKTVKCLTFVKYPVIVVKD